jgi:RNA polymerase sigma factor (TIGR02999 family)
MRQILVEHARRRRAAKRHGGYKVTLEGAESLLKEPAVDLMALDDALKGLARLDPRQSQIVELRFFGGLTMEETAQALNISPATVKREWATVETQGGSFAARTRERAALPALFRLPKS